MNESSLKCFIIGSIYLLSICVKTTKAINWSCMVNATNVPINITELSGLWYEVSRFPPSKMPACLKVHAPTDVVNNEYNLHLTYFNNLNNNWKYTEENITFPWNNNTQNGLFELLYSGDNVSVDANFKFMGLFESYAFVCGYSGVAPSVSILRLLSRKPTVTTDLKNEVDKLLDMFGITSSDLTWVEQGPRCNGASYVSSNFSILLIALIVLIKSFN